MDDEYALEHAEPLTDHACERRLQADGDAADEPNDDDQRQVGHRETPSEPVNAQFRK
jgi:hypothetical protein